ncbi:hypothetical protein BDW62DRAFT_97998 [Aspergillus aurantiobrunneus]
MGRMPHYCTPHPTVLDRPNGPPSNTPIALTLHGYTNSMTFHCMPFLWATKGTKLSSGGAGAKNRLGLI